MRLLTLACLIPLLSLPISSRALTCLSNGAQVNTDATTEQVLETCGDPDDQARETTPIIEQQQLTQWYYLANFDNRLKDADHDENRAIIRLVLQFSTEKKVRHVQIYTSANTPPNEKALKMIGSAINIGDSQTQVEDILRQHFAVKQVIANVTVGQDTVDTWTYSNNNKKQVFTFTNNQLTAHKTSNKEQAATA
jgi:hypothetical protein